MHGESCEPIDHTADVVVLSGWWMNQNVQLPDGIVAPVSFRLSVPSLASHVVLK